MATYGADAGSRAVITKRTGDLLKFAYSLTLANNEKCEHFIRHHVGKKLFPGEYLDKRSCSEMVNNMSRIGTPDFQFFFDRS